MINKSLFTSDKKDWGTPQALFDTLNNEFNFTLDVCANESNAKLPRYFTPEEDGLVQSWAGEHCFMNPPYGEPEKACEPNCKKKTCKKRGYHLTEDAPGIIHWVKKAFEESQKGALVIGLLPARTDTIWWQKYVMEAVEIRLIKGRLAFVGGPNTAPFPSAIVKWGNYRSYNHPFVYGWDWKIKPDIMGAFKAIYEACPTAWSGMTDEEIIQAISQMRGYEDEN